MMYASAGPAEPGGEEVYVLDDGAPTALLADLVSEPTGVEPLDPRTDLVNHSPSGFSWGYAGSGPAQLALAILAHHRNDQYALRHYQDFKVRYIAEQSADKQFHVNAETIDELLD